MKIRLRIPVPVLVSVLGTAGILLTGCGKANGPGVSNPGSTSIAGLVQNASDATIYYSQLTRTHLDTVLSSTGPFTAFVPVDDAFAAYGLTSNVLDALPVDSVKQLLLYHTIAGEGLLTSNFPTGPDAKIVTANGDSVFVTANSNGVFVNGVPALSADIIASNGVIDALSGVLLPPQGNIVQLLQSDTSMTFMLAAIMRASEGSTNLDSMLSNGGPYTLFAPVNNAFRTSGYSSPDDFNSIDPDSVANIVKYHIVPARMFTSDVVNGQTRPTLADSTILFTAVSSTPAVQGKGNNSAANVLRANVMAHNGVLFVIDEVLMEVTP